MIQNARTTAEMQYCLKYAKRKNIVDFRKETKFEMVIRVKFIVF